MAIIGKVKTIYEDKERTQAVFPRTVFSAVSNSDGVGMDELLVGAVCIGEDLNNTQPVSVDADTLGGQSSDYYAKASEVSKLNSNLSNILLGKCVQGAVRGSEFNMDTHFSYENGYAIYSLAFDVFTGGALGTKPFGDGFLITMIWRPLGDGDPILRQVAFEDTDATSKHRAYYNGVWSSWV